VEAVAWDSCEDRDAGQGQRAGAGETTGRLVRTLVCKEVTGFHVLIIGTTAPQVFKVTADEGQDPLFAFGDGNVTARYDVEVCMLSASHHTSRPHFCFSWHGALSDARTLGPDVACFLVAGASCRSDPRSCCGALDVCLGVWVEGSVRCRVDALLQSERTPEQEPPNLAAHHSRSLRRRSGIAVH
jgi:hypothetical protein